MHNLLAFCTYQIPAHLHIPQLLELLQFQQIRSRTSYLVYIVQIRKPEVPLSCGLDAVSRHYSLARLRGGYPPGAGVRNPMKVQGLEIPGTTGVCNLLEMQGIAPHSTAQSRASRAKRVAVAFGLRTSPTRPGESTAASCIGKVRLQDFTLSLRPDSGAIV